MPRFDPTRSRRRIIRLSILAGIIFVIVGGLFVLYKVQSGKQQVQTQEIVQQARDAFEEESYATVIELLENPDSASSTIPEIREDAELLYLYVKARREVPLLQAEHLRRTIAPLQQIVRLEPENVEARRELLDLLLLAGRPDDALKTAEQLANRYPQDPELIRYVGESSRRLGDDERALEALLKSGALDPMHVPTQIAIARLLRVNEQDTGPFIKNAQTLYEQNPNDPRARAIRALGYLVINDMVQARSMLISAASEPAPDPDFVPLMVELLDSVDLYAQSRQYLDENAGPGISDFAGREALFRSFDAGDLRGVLERVEGLDPTEVFPDILAVWAIASQQSGDNAQADKLIDELRRRDDEIAKAWARVLPLVFAEEPDPAALIDTLTDLTRERDGLEGLATQHHPYLRQMLGETYLRVEEPEAAIQSMRAAAESRDAWFRPHRLLAQTLLELGRPAEAHAHAEKALLRHPTDSAKALRATTQLLAADPTDAYAVRRAIEQAEALLQQVPDEPQVLQASVGLLARARRQADARRHIEDALRLDPPASADLLLALAELSRRYELGMGDAINRTLGSAYAANPEVVAAQARALAEAGDPSAGLALINRAMPEPAGLDWRVVMARYRSLIGADDADDYWIALADEFAGDLTVQLQALRATTASQTNPAFAARAIDRLRALGGASASHWKTEQARLLMDTHSSAQDLERALDLLRESAQAVPDRLDTQMDLTRCLVMLDRYDEAETSARSAMALAPDRPGARLLLGQVLHVQGKHSEARPQLIRVAQDAQANPQLRLNACRLLIDQGERDGARATLSAMREDGSASPDALLLLARLLAAENQVAQADAVWAELLTRPTTQIIAFAAAYYEQTGRQALADQALARLQDAGASPADRLMLQAQASARRGEMQQAFALIERAANLDSTEPARWRNAVQIALALSRPARAVALAQAGLDQAGDDDALRAIVKHRGLLERIETDGTLVPLAIAIVNDPAHRGAAIEALTIGQDTADPAQVSQRLASLAKSEPGFQALHELACDRLLEAGQHQSAYDLASSGMARFANSVTAARVTAMASYQLKDWGTLLSAAEAWGERNPGDRKIADLLLAVAQSELRRFEVAARTLAPHLDRLAGSIEANEGYYEVYTRALVHTGRADEAWALLEPALADDPTARKIAMQRIGNDLQTPEQAGRWVDRVLAALEPGSPERLMLLGMAFQSGLRLENPPLQRQAYDRINALLDAPGPHDVAGYVLHGQFAQQLGDLGPAEASFRRVLRDQPDNPLILNNLAVVLSELGGDKLAEAQTLATRASQLAPGDPNKLDTLARVLLLRGKLVEAEAAIDRAIALQPNRAAWRLTRADILEAQGKTEQADQIRQRYGGPLNN